MKSQYLTGTAKPGRTKNSNTVTLPAPINGLVTSESLLGLVQASAERLDNWVPTRRGVKMRKGSKTHASISNIGAPVVSLIAYSAPTLKKVFAASTTQIFDVTSVASATIPPAAAVSGRTSGYYSFVNFSTTGGQFLTVVNGTDPLLLYDPVGGWVPITATSTPAITGGSTSTLEQVWVYRNRQFFIQASSLVARYLPVGAVAGALGTIDMNGVFQKGGRLVLGATWSIDAGNGLDDKCVFITDQGEAAIYQGSNPASATDWSLVGLYEIGPPMGNRSNMKAGGDLVIATKAGLVPISASLQKGPDELSTAALTKNIEPDWRQLAVDRGTLPWEVLKVISEGYMIVSIPVTAPGQEPIAYVMNIETGKWCRYTNWDARCMAVVDGRLYFGTSDGRIKLADIGGNDDGAPIYYTVVGNPESLGSPAGVKTILQAKGTFLSGTPYLPKITASMDYQVELPAPPDSADDIPSNNWDGALWDVSTWDGTQGASSYSSSKVSIGRTGTVLQYQVQVTGALTPAPNTEFVTIDISFEMGAQGL